MKNMISPNRGLINPGIEMGNETKQNKMEEAILNNMESTTLELMAQATMQATVKRYNQQYIFTESLGQW